MLRLKHFAFVAVLFFNVLALAQPTEFITDLEGRFEQIENLIKEGVLQRLSDGRIDFVKPDSKLVFGGDLMDRGPHSIKLLRMMIDLKTRYPDRVVLIWGNRDMNKLSFGYFRETATGPLEAQVQAWAEKFGLTQALEFHQQELSELRKTAVSFKDACIDFADFITNPQREYLTFLRKGQLVHSTEHVVYAHGGLPTQPGFMPDSSKVYSQVDPWVKELNKWGAQNLQAIIAGLQSGKMPKQGLKLIYYSDALFDSNLKAIWNHDNSVVYGPRYKEDGTFRLPSEATLNWLKASGKSLVMFGHSPAGNVAQFLRGLGILVGMGDTSFGPKGAFSRITIDKDTVQVRGRLGNGTDISYRTNAMENSPIGMLSGNELILGETTDNKLALFRYEGYTINERVVDRNSINLTGLLHPLYDTNSEFEKQKKALLDALEKQGVKNIDMTLFGQDFLKGKEVIFLAGSSAYADPTEGHKAEQMLERLLNSVDPKKTILITGGTDKGPEKIAHEIAARRGIYVHALLVSAAVPQEVSNYVKSYSWVGHDWSAQPKAGMDFIVTFKGLGVILGGGGLLGEALKYGQSIKANFIVANNIRHGNGNVSASMTMAQTMPERAFGDANELMKLLARYEPSLLRLSTVSGPMIEVRDGGTVSARDGFATILEILNANSDQALKKVNIIFDPNGSSTVGEKSATNLLLYIYSLSSNDASKFAESLNKSSQFILVNGESLTTERLKAVLAKFYVSPHFNKTEVAESYKKVAAELEVQFKTAAPQLAQKGPMTNTIDISKKGIAERADVGQVGKAMGKAKK